MADNDVFASPKRRIARAKELMGELMRPLNEYLARPPFRVVAEARADQMIEHKIRFVEVLPDVIGERAVEVTEGLRSALDQACYSVARLVKHEPKHTHFPFGDSAQAITDALSKGQSRDVPTFVHSNIVQFEPFRGGNDVLWSLNRIRNVNQHRFMIPANRQGNGVYIEFMAFNGDGWPVLPPQWNAARDEMLFAITWPGTDFKPDIAPLFDIVFGDVEAISGLPVVLVLESLTEQVETLVWDLEGECKRQGKI